MPEVAQATITVTPVLEGAQQKLTSDLTGAANAAGDQAGKQSGSTFAGSFTKSLIGGTVAVTTAVVGAGAAMVGAAGKTAEYGDQIDKASQKLGVSSTFYQEWDAVLQHSGTSMDSMTGTFKKLATASQDASEDHRPAGHGRRHRTDNTCHGAARQGSNGDGCAVQYQRRRHAGHDRPGE